MSFKIKGEFETKEELVHAVTEVFTKFYDNPETARVEPLKDIIRMLKVKKDDRGIELRKSARNKGKEVGALLPRRPNNVYSGNNRF